ncbi:MAG: HD domain-containing protein [Pirellulaceae bacterium]
MSDAPSATAWQKAASFAAARHDGQYRKDGRTPYVAHPMRVSLIILHKFEVRDETALVAALLHDLLEDTTTDYDDVAEQFGVAVADAVAALTKDSRLPEDQRELAYDRQLTAASWQARLVKLADVCDNFCDAASESERRKIAGKAQRAIVCAGSSPELQPAIQVVAALITNYATLQAP